jgi:septal ring factor EnvC (AmiA/AmiB activator)
MIRALLLAAALGLASLPVRAGLFDDEEARNRIDKLRTDFDELAKRADLAAKNQIDFANQAEVLKSDVAKLRGQIEVIVYELEATQKRQKDFYVDLDTRLPLERPGRRPTGGECRRPKADPASEAHDYRRP